jgi:hypothetical protein
MEVDKPEQKETKEQKGQKRFDVKKVCLVYRQNARTMFADQGILQWNAVALWSECSLS